MAVGLPELLTLMAAAVAIGVPIWFATKAKPVGPRPYRWGAYLGIQTALSSIVLLFFAATTVLRLGHIVLGIILAIVAFCAIASAVGLLRRNRFGVVLFFIVGALAFMLPPSFEATGVGDYFRILVRDSTRGGLPVLVLIAVNAFYFSKRWKFMSPIGSDGAHALPS